MVSSRVYVIDTGTNPKAPTIAKVIEPDEMKTVTKLSTPHTTHCLGSGEIMISAMGDPDGNAKGMCMREREKKRDRESGNGEREG